MLAAACSCSPCRARFPKIVATSVLVSSPCFVPDSTATRGTRAPLAHSACPKSGRWRFICMSTAIADACASTWRSALDSSSSETSDGMPFDLAMSATYSAPRVSSAVSRERTPAASCCTLGSCSCATNRGMAPALTIAYRMSAFLQSSSSSFVTRAWVSGSAEPRTTTSPDAMATCSPRELIASVESAPAASRCASTCPLESILINWSSAPAFRITTADSGWLAARSRSARAARACTTILSDDRSITSRLAICACDSVLICAKRASAFAACSNVRRSSAPVTAPLSRLLTLLKSATSGVMPLALAMRLWLVRSMARW